MRRAAGEMASMLASRAARVVAVVTAPANWLSASASGTGSRAAGNRAATSNSNANGGSSASASAGRMASVGGGAIATAAVSQASATASTAQSGQRRSTRIDTISDSTRFPLFGGRSTGAGGECHRLSGAAFARAARREACQRQASWGSRACVAVRRLLVAEKDACVPFRPQCCFAA